MSLDGLLCSVLEKKSESVITKLIAVPGLLVDKDVISMCKYILNKPEASRTIAEKILLFSTQLQWENILISAAQNNNTIAVNMALENIAVCGVDVNCMGNGSTPLLWAVHHGNLVSTQALIRVGADINKENSIDGSTPLMVASFHGFLDCLHELIKAGADLNKQKNDGSTALMLAGQMNKPECLQLLIDSGADLNKQNKEGQTLLIWAVVENRLDLVKKLIEAKANLDIQDELGCTALICAAAQGSFESVQALVKAGAALNHQVNNGFISQRVRPELTVGGFTALHFAAFQGFEKTVIALLVAGADKDLRTEDNKTACDFALEKGFFDIASLLGFRQNDLDYPFNDQEVANWFDTME